ncbi:hypothetical protein BKA64DRAFT_646034 [Cadophora sp. MPI-SDFR-AT-0126]|nr:hypothetical protein BKA64DRAFT_646034 [Leotiomycetes sp. MPI-SDFR-AT-0126]
MKGKHRHDWKGPIVVLSQPGTLTEPSSYRDIVPSDLRVAADFFRVYGKGLDYKGPLLTFVPAAPYNGNPGGSSQAVQAVLIASKSDEELYGKVKFQEVHIPVNHPVFNYAKPTDISVQMGIPLLVAKTGNLKMKDMEKGDKIKINAFQNRTALFLNIEATLNGERWGFADHLVWDREIGTVLVVRQDKRPITAQQVEAIAKFCRYELCPAMSDLSSSLCDMDDISDEEMRNAKAEFAETQMCKQAFEKFFSVLRQQKLDDGDGSWEHARSPYIN